MRGIVSYGAYVPYWRLQRSAVTGALGQGGGKGTRSVASYDEDTTSMGVEAARIAVRGMPEGVSPGLLCFATTMPAYADKTNATAVHAALDLPTSTPAFDSVGAVRSGVAAMWMAQAAGGLAVVSDIRIGLPGGGDEAAGGDAAAAFVFGDGDDVIATPVGNASSTGEFLDRWRLPEERTSRVWEERFGEFAYQPLIEQAVTDALKGAGLTGTDVDHLVVAGLHARVARTVPKVVGVRPDAVMDDLTATMGNPGAAQAGVLLADVLDRAEPNQLIMVVSVADGCDVWLLRTTEALATYAARRGPTVRAQLEATRDDLPYASFLTWRGLLDREPPRRPEPERTASPPSLRTHRWKYAFVASKDPNGFIFLPPARVSMQGNLIDEMVDVPMADVRATVATFTVDRLAFSLAPPVVGAVVDFDGGGRLQCELTDVDPDSVKIGDRVEMSFRRLFTSQGIHNYFWKARPVRFEQGS